MTALPASDVAPVRERRWPLFDASAGRIVASKRRMDAPGQPKRITLDPPTATGGYRVSDLVARGEIVRALSRDATVVVAEGEPAMDAIVEAGYQAVSFGSASSEPSDAALGLLHSRHVVLWGDNDPPGRAFIHKLAPRLERLPVATLRLVRWDDAPPGGDAADTDPETITRLITTAHEIALLRPVSEPTTAPETASGWETPLPIGTTATLPPFPVDALPPWLAEFVVAEAEATQTPVDLAGAIGIGMLATAAGRVRIEPVAGWTEPTNVFIAAPMPPGSRKSQVARDMMAPILEREADLVLEATPGIVEAASARRVAELRLSKLERAAAGAEASDERRAAEHLAANEAIALEAMPSPATPRLFTSDATPEAVASLLAEQGGVLSVLSAEGGGLFEILAGRYSDGRANLDVFLMGHAGDMLRVDRKGRPSEFVDRPALTVVLAIQPSVLIKASRNPEMRGRGLLDRFLWVLPADRVGYRRMDPTPVSPSVRAAYATALRRMADGLAGLDDHRTTVGFTPDALLVLREWQHALEPRRAATGELGHLQGWASKADGAVVRIAGLLHLADHHDGDLRPVRAETMVAAVRVGHYLVAHAVAAFGLMHGEEGLSDAEAILGWIRREGLAEFSRRDAHRAMQARFPRAADLEPGLVVLAERGWIAARSVDRPPMGRPPGPRYLVNPYIRGTK